LFAELDTVNPAGGYTPFVMVYCSRGKKEEVKREIYKERKQEESRAIFAGL